MEISLLLSCIFYHKNMVLQSRKIKNCPPSPQVVTPRCNYERCYGETLVLGKIKNRPNGTVLEGHQSIFYSIRNGQAAGSIYFFTLTALGRHSFIRD